MSLLGYSTSAVSAIISVNNIIRSVPMGSRVNMTEQDFMQRHFLQVSMNETEAGASSNGPSVEEVIVS